MRLNAQILNRFDSQSNWTSENPTLASGELGIQSDGRFKIGDGATAWNSLDYAGGAVEFTNYLLADGTRELAGHLLPEMTGASGVVSARDIGSSTQKIRRLYVHDAYIDAGSLYVNNKLVLQDDSGTITVSTDADQDLKIKTTGTGDVVFESENEVNSVAAGGIEFTVPSDHASKHVNFSNESAGGNITFYATGSSAQVQLSATDEIDLTATNIDVNGAMDVSGEITFGTLHHHNLTGLADDDHTQYILANGTRAFTGVVSGITPTSGGNLATKDYVDGFVQGLDWQDSVLDRIAIGSAVESTGNRYISTETSGGWTINYIYEWNGASWDETAVSEGLAAWVEDEDVLYTYNGSAWVKFGSTITHDNLNAVNSGTYRHLSSSQVTDLTDGNNCSSHKHDDLYGDRCVSLPVCDADTVVAVANGIVGFAVPVSLNGYNLTDVLAGVSTVGSSVTTVRVRRLRSGAAAYPLSTNVTISASAYYANDGVINASYDDMATGDMLFVDVTGAGTGAKGLSVTLTFNKP